MDDGTDTYLYGVNRIAQVNGASTNYFLGDALGSVRQLTDGYGQVTLTRSYDPFGKLTQTLGIAQTNFGFTGEFTDPTGLVYLRARHYSPEMGRFLTGDIWKGNANQPISYNKWVYANANPVRFTDPTGRNPFVVALLAALAGPAAGAAVGATAAGTFGYFMYPQALAGQCGCEMQQQAIAAGGQWQFVEALALGGGLIGAYAGALVEAGAAAGPAGVAFVGGIGVAVDGDGLGNNNNIIKNETGLTNCTITRALIDVAGIALSATGIAEGVKAWRASGSWSEWASSEEALSSTGSPSLYSKNLGDLFGKSAEQIRQIIPSDWTVQYLPRPGYEQWIFTSPDGLEQVRIHQPMLNPGDPWQVRWGVKDIGQIPAQYKPLEAPPNNYDSNYWLYFDRYGQPQKFNSKAVHEWFTVNVTLADMIRVFGK